MPNGATTTGAGEPPVNPPGGSGAKLRRVLVVEDCPEDSFLVQEYLRQAPEQFVVETAGTLAEARQRLGAHAYDVVLADMALPDSCGLDTARELAAHPSGTPLLILSGLQDEAVALRTVEAGAQDYLVKGEFDSALLVRAIRYAIQRAAAERQLQQERGLLRSVIDNILDAIYVKDLQGRYLLGNAAHAQQLGLASPGEVVGRTSADYFPKETAQRFAEDDAAVLHRGVPIINRHEPAGERGGKPQWLSTTKVPLRDAAGQIIGLVGIGRDITARKLAEQKLASYAEQLREKNALLEDDLLMAREVQQAFLPQQFPSFPRSAAAAESALRFFSRYLPTTALGGDFFHVQPISDTRAGLFICDVMGHGVRAALVTAIERTLVEELLEYAEDPGEFLTQMNASLLAILRRTNSPMFVSAFYLVADLAEGTLHYANAGHPCPLHLRRDAGRLDLLGGPQRKPGPALGVFDDSDYTVHQADLAPRDLVVLFTDGIYEFESARGELFDQALLERLLTQRRDHGTERLFDEVLEAAARLSATGSFEDDVCLVGMEVQHLLETSATAPPPLLHAH